MAEFTYRDLFELGTDRTPYRKLEGDYVASTKFNGQPILQVAREGLTALAAEAFNDISHLLRPGHLQQLRSILDDPEASANDRFVAYELLKNVCISAGGVLPMCQDTGTAIVKAKKGERVSTGGGDEEAIARGVFNTYQTSNLRYSQMAPLNMYDEVNTGTNLPGVIQHNSILFDSSGNLKTPGTTTTVTQSGASTTLTFRINYAAILYWLSQSPKHFPSTIQAGRIRFYTSMPDGTDNSLNNRWWTSAPNTLNNNERFWKEYIDFVLGYTASQTTASSYSNARAYIGNGDMFTWSGSTIAVNQHVDRLPTSPSRNPTTPYLSGTTGPHQTSTTGAFKTSTTSAKAAVGATTVSVNTLGSAPATTNYVTFGTPADTTRVYNTASGSTATTLKVAPALTAAVASGAGVQLYSSNNAAGATAVSLSPALGAATTANSDYVGFGGSTANLYKVTNSTTNQLTLGSGLAAAASVSGTSVQVYGSNGAAGATKISVTGLASAPVANSDYLILAGDTTNPYLITAATSFGSGAYILTISPGLASAVNVSGATVQIFSPYMNYTDDVKRPKYHFWFGPMTWVDWLGNYNTGKFAWPGNVHEAQAWACKVGIQTAIIAT